ncbi:MAG: LacI family DNA-binding transcriptional regulator [Aggregatilineales bacterium]
MFIKSSKKKNEQRSTPVTMWDVAQRAGVAQSTVSRVLNQSASSVSISNETREKVMEAVAQLGYYPNMTARALRTQRTHMVAIMVADISNAFYHSIARAVQDFFVLHHYDVLIANTDHLYENEQRFCQAMLRRPVDGIVMVPYHLKTDEIVDLVERTGASLTMLGQHMAHPLFDTLWCDDGKATYDTVNWLVEKKGYTKIGYFRSPLALPTGRRRFDAYLSAMHDRGLPVEAEWVQEGDFTIEGGQQAMRALLETHNLPRVIIACNDLIAIGAASVALDANYCIPEDIALVGFDDIQYASLFRPSLTTIAQSPNDMGTRLAQMLYERIEGLETGTARRIEIPLRLIERQSA